MSGTAELGVVIVHGMGDPKASFAEPLIEGLRSLLGDDAHAVAFEPCFWSPILQDGENEVWRRLQKSRGMQLDFARKWIISSLGDPTGYLSGYERDGKPAMHTVHERFAATLKKVADCLDDPDHAPIIVMAHSLGGVVVTNYLWDLERAAGEVGNKSSVEVRPEHAAARRTFAETSAERLETLAGLITFGCNIPLFLPPTLHYECVQFPRRTLPAKLKLAARWLNIFDPYDILGYPLSDLWDEPNGTTIIDIALNAGTFPVSITPLSHNYYWTDEKFQSLVVAELESVLKAARAP